MRLGMIWTWVKRGGWSVQLIAGLWLLLGQAAIAAEALPKRHVVAPHEWLTQAVAADPIEITGIQLEETSAGITIRLEATGELAAPETSTSGNAAIADIANARLNLPTEEAFSAAAPAAGIALIDIANQPNSQVRIAITGTAAPPTVPVSTGATDLIVNIVVNESTQQLEQSQQSAPEERIQLLVTGDQIEDNYFTPDASSATRTDTPILETPASIQVIPQQVLTDQQALDLGDALQNISGTSVNSTEGRGFQVSLRGFEGASVFRDGFRLYSPNDNGDAAGQGFPEIANIERIEVLRGPASVLFGQSDAANSKTVL